MGRARLEWGERGGGVGNGGADYGHVYLHESVRACTRAPGPAGVCQKAILAFFGFAANSANARQLKIRYTLI
ncbi:hypothetical protein FKP32DRAFT_1593736 [Trametes sanguinea]|nr:hypothetical protein FKP32DRAFT_938814 [Trametes sanguinea]KAI9062164.1 hypothetical protein FKP32DRAFT_1593736 [Trametes sanguinea]